MKCFKTLLLLAVATCALLASCKKDKPEPPFGADALNSGRAAIKFTPSKPINSLRYFEVKNTAQTSAQNRPMNVSDVRNVVLEATETTENTITRKAIIIMVLRPGTQPSINLALSSGFPLATVQIESYGWLGYTRRSQSGTLTVTRFTATEIEGRFSVTFDDGTTVDDGQFAGKF